MSKLINPHNTSSLIVEKKSELGKIVLKVLESWKLFGKEYKPLTKTEKSWERIMAYTKKIIIVDGGKYDVVKSRLGTPTKNGRIEFLVNEMENEYN